MDSYSGETYGTYQNLINDLGIRDPVIISTFKLPTNLEMKAPYITGDELVVTDDEKLCGNLIQMN